MRVAALLTCFNRKEKTLLCLKRLLEIAPDIAVYLVDDKSTDGTSKAIEEHYPTVNIIEGNGNLFWNRGMSLAWLEAAKNDYDYYLWLNDDVVLHRDFMYELMECLLFSGQKAIISGIIEGKEGEILYGGFDKHKRLIEPNGQLQGISYLNGNVVLIPKDVYEILGSLDEVYHHDMGDVDYGFRATLNNISVFTTRKAIAIGEKNSICRERADGTTLTKRFKRLYSPLGSNPKLNFYFRRKYRTIFNAIGYYFFQHALNLMPDKLNSYFFGNKYK